MHESVAELLHYPSPHDLAPLGISVDSLRRSSQDLSGSKRIEDESLAWDMALAEQPHIEAAMGYLVTAENRRQLADYNLHCGPGLMPFIGLVQIVFERNMVNRAVRKALEEIARADLASAEV